MRLNGMTKSDDWKSLVPGCFGNADGKFAIHVCDLLRASELLYACIKSCVALTDVISEGESYLREKYGDQSTDQKALENHINAQKIRMEKLFSCWLN